jgi:hypothetical protein
MISALLLLISTTVWEPQFNNCKYVPEDSWADAQQLFAEHNGEFPMTPSEAIGLLTSTYHLTEAQAKSCITLSEETYSDDSMSDLQI